MVDPWFLRPGSPGNPQWLGLWGAGHYIGPERSCSGRWLLPRPETLLQCTSVHLSVHGAAQHKKLTFTAIVKSRPYNVMDWRHHLSSIHSDQCASHPATYAPKPIHLCDAWILTRKWKYNGPLTRYVKLQVAHAPGMPGTFSPAADFKGNRKLAIPTCITARAWRTCRDACRDRAPAVTGKTFPAFPAHAHLQFCVSGKRPMPVADVPNTMTSCPLKAALPMH